MPLPSEVQVNFVLLCLEKLIRLISTPTKTRDMTYMPVLGNGIVVQIFVLRVSMGTILDCLGTSMKSPYLIRLTYI